VARAFLPIQTQPGADYEQRTIWEFHRNTALNAVGFFKPVGGVKPPLISHRKANNFEGPNIPGPSAAIRTA
jgi:hypothetical protein